MARIQTSNGKVILGPDGKAYTGEVCCCGTSSYLETGTGTGTVLVPQTGCPNCTCCPVLPKVFAVSNFDYSACVAAHTVTSDVAGVHMLVNSSGTIGGDFCQTTPGNRAVYLLYKTTKPTWSAASNPFLNAISGSITGASTASHGITVTGGGEYNFLLDKTPGLCTWEDDDVHSEDVVVTWRCSILDITYTMYLRWLTFPGICTTPAVITNETVTDVDIVLRFRLRKRVALTTSTVCSETGTDANQCMYWWWSLSSSGTGLYESFLDQASVQSYVAPGGCNLGNDLRDLLFLTVTSSGASITSDFPNMACLSCDCTNPVPNVSVTIPDPLPGSSYDGGIHRDTDVPTGCFSDVLTKPPSFPACAPATANLTS